MKTTIEVTEVDLDSKEGSGFTKEGDLLLHHRATDGSELIVFETPPRESVQKFLESEVIDLPKKRIGTVEPIPAGTHEPINFIKGAVKKYGNDVSFHDSLMLYIKDFPLINGDVPGEGEEKKPEGA